MRTRCEGPAIQALTGQTTSACMQNTRPATPSARRDESGRDAVNAVALCAAYFEMRPWPRRKYGADPTTDVQSRAGLRMFSIRKPKRRHIARSRFAPMPDRRRMDRRCSATTVRSHAGERSASPKLTRRLRRRPATAPRCRATSTSGRVRHGKRPTPRLTVSEPGPQGVDARSRVETSSSASSRRVTKSGRRTQHCARKQHARRALGLIVGRPIVDRRERRFPTPGRRQGQYFGFDRPSRLSRTIMASTSKP